MSQADTIKEYLVGLGFDVHDDSYAKFKAGIVGASALVATLGAGIVGLSTAITHFVGEAAHDLDKLDEYAKNVNVDAGIVEQFEYAASVLDSSSESARGAIKSVSAAIGDAANGFPRALKLFDRLGLSFKKNNGQVKTAVELFDDIREKIKDLSRPEQISFLGKLGIDSTMLRTLTEDWSDLRAELLAINNAIGMSKKPATELAADYYMAQVKLDKVFTAIRQGIALRLMPQILKSMNDVRRILVENLPMILDKITPILKFVLNLSRWGLQLVLDVADAAVTAAGYIRDLDEATGGWAKVLGAAYLAWKLWNSELANSPTGQVLKLAAAISLLWNDYKTWRDGTGRSAIDWGSSLGRWIIWLGKAYLLWRGFKVIVSSAFSAIWSGIKLIAELWLFHFVIEKLIEATRGWWLVSKLLTALKWVHLTLALYPLLLIIPLVVAALAYLAYELGLFDKQGWKNSMEGYSKFFSWLGGKFSDAGDVIAQWASSGAQSVVDAWEGVKTWFSDWFVWLRDKMPSLPSLSDFGLGGGSGVLAPSPAAAAQLRGGANVTLRNDTNINIASTDPAAAGRATAREQDGVFARQTRGLATVLQ